MVCCLPAVAPRRTRTSPWSPALPSVQGPRRRLVCQGMKRRDRRRRESPSSAREVVLERSRFLVFDVGLNQADRGPKRQADHVQVCAPSSPSSHRSTRSAIESAMRGHGSSTRFPPSPRSALADIKLAIRVDNPPEPLQALRSSPAGAAVAVSARSHQTDARLRRLRVQPFCIGKGRRRAWITCRPCETSWANPMMSIRISGRSPTEGHCKAQRLMPGCTATERLPERNGKAHWFVFARPPSESRPERKATMTTTGSLAQTTNRS